MSTDPFSSNLDLYYWGTNGAPSGSRIDEKGIAYDSNNDPIGFYTKDGYYVQGDGYGTKLDSTTSQTNQDKTAETKSPEKKNTVFDKFIDFEKNMKEGIAFGSGFWMLMPEETRREWMDSALSKFSQALSVKYWISQTCLGMQSTQTSAGDGTFVSDLGGMPMVFIWTKGQRVEAAHPNETNTSQMVYDYSYKIEYWAQNPEEAYINSADDMSFNIALYENGVRRGIYNEDIITVEVDGTKSATGSNMIRFDSKRRYTLVCLEFRTPIRDFDGNELTQFCDTIVSYGGEATGYSGGGGNSSGTSGSSGSSGSGDYIGDSL